MQQLPRRRDGYMVAGDKPSGEGLRLALQRAGRRPLAHEAVDLEARRVGRADRPVRGPCSAMHAGVTQLCAAAAVRDVWGVAATSRVLTVPGATRHNRRDGRKLHHVRIMATLSAACFDGPPMCKRPKTATAP